MSGQTYSMSARRIESDTFTRVVGTVTLHGRNLSRKRALGIVSERYPDVHDEHLRADGIGVYAFDTNNKNGAE